MTGPNKFRCHSHYYVWEFIQGTDSQNTSYSGFFWVKKGRAFENTWLPKSIVQDKWIKMSLSSNNHGLLKNTSGDSYNIIFSIGNPVETMPNP